MTGSCIVEAKAAVAGRRHANSRMLCACVLLVPLLTALTATLLLPPTALEDLEGGAAGQGLDVELYTKVHVAMVAFTMLAAILTPDVWLDLGENVSSMVASDGGADGGLKQQAAKDKDRLALQMLLDQDSSDYSLD